MNDAFFFLPALLLVIVFPVLGLIAFVRTGALTEQLRRAEARIAALEQGAAPQAAMARERPAAAPEPAPSPSAARPIQAAMPVFARIEAALASNWFVWLGGGLIALAIVVLVNFSIGAGFFQPPAQLAGAYLLGAALLGAAEWTRRRPPLDAAAHSQLTRLPAVLAAAGLFAWFAASLAGHVALHVIGMRAGFALMALSSLTAIVLALRFGKWLAALGLGGGYLAPALAPSSASAPEALFGYLIALTAAALAVIRLRNWRGFVWLVGGGALAWGFLWTRDILATPAAHQSAAYYILALAALGLAFAWSRARAPILFTSWRTLRAGWTESVVAAHVLAIAAGVDLLLLAVRGEYQVDAALIAILALCVLACVSAYVREAFALLAVAGAALGAATVLAWPTSADAAPLAATYFFFYCGAFGFVFTAGGWLMMTANREKATGAALAALGPLTIVLASHEKAAALRPAFDWAAAAIGLMMLNVFGLWQIARAFGGVDKAPGASAAFALGAAAGAVLGVLFGFSSAPLWGAGALALLTPAMAALDLRFKLPALRSAASVVALIVTWTLGPSMATFFAPLTRTPLLNPIAPVYGLAAVAFWAAARVYKHAGLSKTARVVQALEASALIVAVLGASFEIRHLATGGDLGAFGFGLAELAGDVIIWLALALGLAARFGAVRRPVMVWAETIAFAGAALLAVFGAGLTDNPWWGGAPAPVPGPPVFNLLFAAYGLPAILFSAYAALRRRQGAPRRAALAGAIAVWLAFLNVTLEVRRLFHGPDLAGPPMGAWETWSYTAAWLSLAAALLGLGLMRRQPSLRYASFVVLLAAIIKAFVFDLHALNGVLLAAQLLGLGVSVIGVTLIYQRFVIPRAGRADPNLTPPR